MYNIYSTWYVVCMWDCPNRTVLTTVQPQVICQATEIDSGHTSLAQARSAAWKPWQSALRSTEKKPQLKILSILGIINPRSFSHSFFYMLHVSHLPNLAHLHQSSIQDNAWMLRIQLYPNSKLPKPFLWSSYDHLAKQPNGASFGGSQNWIPWLRRFSWITKKRSQNGKR